MTKLSNKICIVIPCYNEVKELKNKVYDNFIVKKTDTFICFVDDGSSDGTYEELQMLEKRYPTKVIAYKNSKNLGKAETVRNGINYVCKNYNFEQVGYLDADLATSLEEFYTLTDFVKGEITFVFGSRIMKIGSTIERKLSRFFIGRFIATLISKILGLKVYDTQCGCKIFTKELAEQIFIKPFVSRWLFDVEIFNRILVLYGKEKALTKMLEIPLIRWVDQGDSKVKTSYFFQLWLDLYKINKICKLSAKTQ
ncbi:glycosyltransferase [Cellulophaga sp. F20128]|uniref:glycosyltransferase n=1 Tax=Cellulophaga sp. F20128 TaxID=2926413 RepID=UPI001FF68CCA|nr:glycosyltransferase [Cellulophaga sp. F20128]